MHILQVNTQTTYSVAELTRRLSASPSTVSRELDRLVGSGLVSETRRGTLRLVQADSSGPLARPLTELLALTYGPAPILVDPLASLADVGSAAERRLGREVNIHRVSAAAWWSPAGDPFLTALRSRPLHPLVDRTVES